MTSRDSPMTRLFLTLGILAATCMDFANHFANELLSRGCEGIPASENYNPRSPAGAKNGIYDSVDAGEKLWASKPRKPPQKILWIGLSMSFATPQGIPDKRDRHLQLAIHHGRFIPLILGLTG